MKSEQNVPFSDYRILYLVTIDPRIIRFPRIICI